MEYNEEEILSLNKLSLSFLSEETYKKVIDNVSFSVKKGKTLGILGESGSGKTVSTLALIKLMEFPPARIDSGAVFFSIEGKKKEDLLSLSEKKLLQYRGKRISCIFQNPMTSLNPSMRCGKQVAEVLKFHCSFTNKNSKEEVLRLFEEVKLPNPNKIYNSYPHEISGGQRQRVMIAMAIACCPDVLIADEPTTALDVLVQKSIIDLLKELQLKYKMSIIFISHNLGILKTIADFVVVMNNGKIVEAGTIEDIFYNPKNAYTKGLMACKPPLYYDLIKLPTVEEIEQMSANNLNFSTTDYINSLKIERKYPNSPKTDTIFSVEHLKVYYPIKYNIFGNAISFFKAVDDVSFKIFKGKTLSLLGESGCGKSTTAKVLAGLINPSFGNIVYKDINVNQLNNKEKRSLCKDIQMIFQDPYSSLNPKMTITATVIEPMKVHKVLDNDKQRQERASYLLNIVGLDKKEFFKYPHELSGGQCQRVCIARSLTLSPQLLICDEPVSALDVSVQAKVLNLLQELKEEFQLSMLFISHDVAVVRHISDYVAVMRKGTIIETSNPLSLINNPQNDYTKQLINSSL